MAELLTIEEALARIAAQIVPLPAEDVPLEQTSRRILAAPLLAALDLPPFTNAAMDGYALRAADTPGQLRVVGESAAGAPFEGRVQPGEAVTISTGAAMPDGADAVAPIEIVDVIDQGNDAREIALRRVLAERENVRLSGSDVHAGAEVLTAGSRIGAGQIGAAASIGARSLSCGARPRVAVLTTGTELAAPGTILGPGQIYDSNGPMLRCALEGAGALATIIPAAADTVQAHRTALVQALDYDVLLTTGGVSVGEHDIVRAVERELGVEEVFWRIAMRPGKPLSFGVRERDRGRTLVFGLPGNPVSALVCFELFVHPALLALQGVPHVRPAFRSVTLGADIRRNRERDDLIRVALDKDDSTVHPLSGQQSHQVAVCARADGVARIPRGEGELTAGTSVSFLAL